MNVNKRPIKRALLFRCLVFILLLCILFVILSYFRFSKRLYLDYDSRLENVVDYVERHTDADDLRECIRTGVTSEKFDELQQFLNGMVDDFDLMYLYIVIPDPENGLMYSVCSATSDAERAAGEEDYYLMEPVEGYTRETLNRFLSFWDIPGYSFFEENSDWGNCYTCCKPLAASDGEVIALICADLDPGALHRDVTRYVVSGLLMTALVGGVFMAILFFWIRQNITDPILALEKSARDFAALTTTRPDPSTLRFVEPDIHTENEVQSLSASLVQMSRSLTKSVRSILSAEARVRSAEQEAEGMARLAYQDALTHVKSKAAYADVLAELNEQIRIGTAEFAILMLDMNGLKRINDGYGHERGDIYLVGSCQLVCRVFKHSPVYRIGGDEFIVLLRGQDYENRDALAKELCSRFRALEADASLQPWERYSAAGGIAVYDPDSDADAESVQRRADEAMYRTKQELKQGR